MSFFERAVNAGEPRMTRESDEVILTFLDLRDHEGLSARQIAERVGDGVTKGKVIGACRRVDMEPHQSCRCNKPENRDGGMPRRWWA